MPIVDTSFLIALKNGDDPHHREAFRLAAMHSSLVIPGIVLHEFLLVAFQRGKRAAGTRQGERSTRQALDEIQGQPVFHVEPLYDPKDASALFLEEPGLSYADAVAISVSLQTGHELLTFDEFQAAVAAARSKSP